MANSIAEALGNFAQFIGQEQQRLEIEDQKDLMRASTQRITEAFSKVNPLATEEDIRQLMLDSISDAAGLGTLDTSMPLIQGFYNDSINAIKNYKGRKQDEALKQYAKREGFVSPSDDITGEAQLNLMQYEQGQRKGLTVEEEQATYNIIIDPRTGKEVPGSRMDIGPGWKEKMDLTLQGQMRLASYQDRLQGNFTSAGALTPEGQLITYDKRTGFAYVQSEDENGKPVNVPYTGKFIKGNKSDVSRAIEEQRLYKESKNSQYQTASSIAVSIANDLGLTDEKGAQLTGDAAFKKFYAMTPSEFTKISEGKASGKFTQFKEEAGWYDLYHNKIREAVDVIEYNDAKELYNVTDAEFSGYYNSAIKDINNKSKPFTQKFIRDKVLDAANLSETEAAIFLKTDEDWEKLWHNLPNKSKFSIIKALKEQNAQ